MDAETVVTRTSKGEQAIAQRTPDLERHLRYVLILVNGESNVAELRTKGTGLPDFDESLWQLAEQGFISPAETAAGSESVSVTDIKEQLIGAARELLGSNAEKVVKKLQAAPDSRDGLLEATRSCKKMVKLLIDGAKAELLMVRCRKFLEAIQ